MEAKVSPPLTEEQKERIEANRQRALALQAAAKQAREATPQSLKPSENSISQQSSSQKVEDIHCDQLIGSNVCGVIMSAHDRQLYWDCFGERCCATCRSMQGSDWDLISRAEVISEYLIPVDSVQLMKYSTRPNPHNPHWTAMKLFLRRHARLKAYARFGGAEGLEKEILKRKQAKFEKEFAKSNEIFSSIHRLDDDTAGGMTGFSSSALTFSAAVVGDVSVGQLNKRKHGSGDLVTHVSDNKADDNHNDDEDDEDECDGGGGFFTEPDDSNAPAVSQLVTVTSQPIVTPPLTEPVGRANKKVKRSARHVMANFAASLLASKGK